MAVVKLSVVLLFDDSVFAHILESFVHPTTCAAIVATVAVNKLLDR